MDVVYHCEFYIIVVICHFVGGHLDHIIETKRLYLRELNLNDKDELADILCDPDSMKYYPNPFSMEQTVNWIKWNIDNYKKYKHGLWAVILKGKNVLLGDCGLTIQEIEGEEVLELGYHIRKEYWNKGYATEAAKACIEYAIDTLKMEKIYSYTKSENLPSIRVAEKVGMRFVKQFEKVIMGSTVNEVLYCIHRQNDI